MRMREATASDLPAMVSLNREVQSRHAVAFPEIFKSDPSDQEVASAFRAMMAAPTSYWLVAEEGEVIAYLSAEFRQRGESWCTTAHQVCYLAAIVVDATHRHRGVAKALLTTLKQEAITRNTFQIELDVWAFNEDSQQVFANLGFRPLHQRMRIFVEQENRGKN